MPAVSVTRCYESSMIYPGLTFPQFPTGDKLRYMKLADLSQNPSLMAHREKFIYAYICKSHFDGSQYQKSMCRKDFKPRNL